MTCTDFILFALNLSRVQNKVSLTAVKVKPDQNIETISPSKRNCLFSHEHPLKAHQKYSQVWRRTKYNSFIVIARG